MILSEEAAVALTGATRSTIALEMPPPRLVVEVVSPGKQNSDSPEATLCDRDYRYKRSQYQARAIAEYWIADPIAQRVTVLTLVEGLYEETVFEGDVVIESPLLKERAPAGALTARQVLQGRE